MILLSDPQITAVPLADNGEPLVDLRQVPELRLDARLADARGMYAMLREHTLERLLKAQAGLPDGLRLLIIEAYRPLDLQRQYFQSYQDELHLRYPNWPPTRVHVEASKYVSPPEVAPHSTGGTVDLTLCTEDGGELDMGTAVNDSPEASQNACYFDAPAVTGTARGNREILAEALRAAGMVNYPTEWWHWSFGDRYWALTTKATSTRYGPVALG